MDFLTTRTMEITSLALDGLSSRHKAITSNVANASTVGYKRMDVQFEDQLQKIIETENIVEKQRKNSMSLTFSSNSIDQSSLNNRSGINSTTGYLKMAQEAYKSFSPEMVESDQDPVSVGGSNVNVEYEMAQLAKTGTKYSALTQLQGKMFKGLQEVIRGGGM